MKGRVLEVSLGDLNKDEDQAYRKFKLRIDEVQGRNCLTNFHGMDLTTDKLRSLVKKWQTKIEGAIDVKTLDGYVLRMFCMAFTKRKQNQVKKNCYAKTSQVKQIRKKMFEVITREVSTVELKDVVLKLIPEVIGKEVEKACQGVFPLQNVFIRKVKLIKQPKYDVQKLLEIHSEVAEEVGTTVQRPAAQKAAPVPVPTE